MGQKLEILLTKTQNYLEEARHADMSDDIAAAAAAGVTVSGAGHQPLQCVWHPVHGLGVVWHGRPEARLAAGAQGRHCVRPFVPDSNAGGYQVNMCHVGLCKRWAQLGTAEAQLGTAGHSWAQLGTAEA